MAGFKLLGFLQPGGKIDAGLWPKGKVISLGTEVLGGFEDVAGVRLNGPQSQTFRPLVGLKLKDQGVNKLRDSGVARLD